MAKANTRTSLINQVNSLIRQKAVTAHVSLTISEPGSSATLLLAMQDSDQQIKEEQTNKFAYPNTAEKHATDSLKAVDKKGNHPQANDVLYELHTRHKTPKNSFNKLRLAPYVLVG